MAEMNEETGLCQVYLWLKKKGHIALQADGGPYISFWPARKHELFEQVPSKTYPSLDAEIQKYGPPDKTLYVSDMNIGKIRKWWEEFKEGNPTWDLVAKNCAMVVYRALGEGSDRFKDRKDSFTVTPKAVAKLAEYDMKKRKAKIRFSSSCMPSFI